MLIILFVFLSCIHIYYIVYYTPTDTDTHTWVRTIKTNKQTNFFLVKFEGCHATPPPCVKLSTRVGGPFILTKMFITIFRLSFYNLEKKSSTKRILREMKSFVSFSFCEKCFVAIKYDDNFMYKLTLVRIRMLLIY